MQPIAAEFTEGNFRYRQLERYGNLALYEQRHKIGPMVRYEVVRLRARPAYTWPNGTTTPDHEAYPGATSWGTDGFTAYSLQEARAMLVPWLAQLAAGADDAPEEVPPV